LLIASATTLLKAGEDASNPMALALPAAEPLEGIRQSATDVGIDPALTNSWERLGSTNLQPLTLDRAGQQDWRARLEFARHQRLLRQHEPARTNLVAILESNAGEDLKRTALLEMALLAEDQNDLTRAQQVYAQYLSRWPDNPNTPEILLRQGLLYRRMGLHTMALNKFYSVMTSSLSLKTDQLPYYQRMVLQAQTEIAETHYQSGHQQEAVDFLTRLLKLNDPELNRGPVLFKLVRSLAAMQRDAEAIARGFEFVEQFPANEELAEVRFHLAVALKHSGRNSEALLQVLLLLKEQEGAARTSPLTWAYWRQRAGNEIGNQLYREGDFASALAIYVALAELDPSPAWQLPVWYQIGITYERLEQPAKAAEYYVKIIERRNELGPEPAPTMRTILDMAQWRKDFLQWRQAAESSAKQLKPAELTALPVSTNSLAMQP
jgi:tetratricopeptide (TPR) repeat protein